MKTLEQSIRDSIAESGSRFDLWIDFLNSRQIRNMAEIGVYRGDFAQRLLAGCSSIKKYYMVDPWRHLGDWNKPANVSDDVFERFLSETKSKTEFAAERRIILRGKTVEVIDEIPDGELDFAYIDGDHTLKGITIDLIRVYPKVKDGGWIGGDDFTETIWQHRTDFEPTLVFPFAVYFAEAVGERIYALPHSQFLIEKNRHQPFSFVDLTGRYTNLGLKEQFRPRRILTIKMAELFPLPFKLFRIMKNLISRLS